MNQFTSVNDVEDIGQLVKVPRIKNNPCRSAAGKIKLLDWFSDPSLRPV